MPLGRWFRKIFPRFQATTVVLAPLGELRNDKFGFWTTVQNLHLGNHSVQVAFQTGEQPPTAVEVEPFLEVQRDWDILWEAIVLGLKTQLEDDGPGGERESFISQAAPIGLEFLADQGRWTVPLSGDIYQAHIVTVLMNRRAFESARLDG